MTTAKARLPLQEPPKGGVDLRDPVLSGMSVVVVPSPRANVEVPDTALIFRLLHVPGGFQHYGCMLIGAAGAERVCEVRTV